MKILFFGTAAVSMPFLERLAGAHELVGAVTRPDRPADRGHQLQQPAVKVFALERGIPVFQPEEFTDDLVAQLAQLSADVGVAVSYGALIPERVFTLPRFGCFNVHFSLLPQYRGAGPVQWAIIRGETVTGVTTFWIEKGLDTGPVLVQQQLAIHPEDTAESLMARLIPAGLAAMDETIARVAAGNCTGTPQTGTASYAPQLSREDGHIDWKKPVHEIYNLIRGARPWPGAYAVVKNGKLEGQRLKIHRAQLVTDVDPDTPGASIGHVIGLVRRSGFVVGCGSGRLLVEEVQPENRKPMPAWDFIQGNYLEEKSYFA